MPKYLNSVVIMSQNPDAARESWARLGFVVAAGDGRIALGSAAIYLRGAETAPPPRVSHIVFADSNSPAAECAAHGNGARGLAALVKVSENPAALAEFCARDAGQREIRATSAGIEIKLENARQDILTPTAFTQFYGDPDTQDPQNPKDPGLTADALVFAADLDAVRAFFGAAGLAFEEKFGRLVLAERLAGLILAFEA
ncbi:hypothetical protein CCR94_19990 [Rhodoblastus sphagnicola]|uniref:VOC domain-containing protein n=1 Tax=Rhodoblastus sphagnicola TaxID=333368 RepID=A0A2S6MYS8_9HYPH|nr:hypothetical protein [Rhodoblastus sphagnicola]MBB4196453.1 hypothetical protein [Rhodoblastus sphagnicola]PPQ27510.1 hypothetical protein CCR94_19990 [Rhodoblastus sphagnicola]